MHAFKLSDVLASVMRFLIRLFACGLYCCINTRVHGAAFLYLTYS